MKKTQKPETCAHGTDRKTDVREKTGVEKKKTAHGTETCDVMEENRHRKNQPRVNRKNQCPRMDASGARRPLAGVLGYGIAIPPGYGIAVSYIYNHYSPAAHTIYIIIKMPAGSVSCTQLALVVVKKNKVVCNDVARPAATII